MACGRNRERRPGGRARGRGGPGRRRPGRRGTRAYRRHAPVYEQIYGGRFAPQAAVSALAAAGRDGGVLELGAGTGRFAIPLAARGIRVDGIEASQAMIEQLRSRPGSSAVGIIIPDLAGFDLPYQDYTAAAASLLASNSDVRP